ncbi:hypothetical protein NOCARDAX2BIS_480041 [Nocardioides sp. AX2bis]|nr:hypothetical protein NOCARDAX2BIS_480041 [Nocardioides sp. AX2bis]
MRWWCRDLRRDCPGQFGQGVRGHLANGSCFLVHKKKRVLTSFSSGRLSSIAPHRIRWFSTPVSREQGNPHGTEGPHRSRGRPRRR